MSRVYKAARMLVKDDAGNPVIGKDGREMFRWQEVGDREAGVFFIDYRDVSGRRIRKQVEATNRQLATAVLNSKTAWNDRAEILGVDSVEQAKPKLFSDFFQNTFLKNNASMAKSTLEGYARDWKTAEPIFGKLTLRSITAGHVMSYMKARAKDGAGPGGVNCSRRFICTVLTMALKYKMIEENPVSEIEPLDGEGEGRDFDFNEQAKIFQELEDWMKPITELALNTGMRRDEIAGLEWSRVKLDAGFIGLGAKDTKGRYARRVPMNSRVRSILEAQTPAKDKDGRFIPYVFVSPKTLTRYSVDSLSRAFRRAVKAAGLPTTGTDRIVFHSTRHCFVSRMVRAGKSDRFIMEIVGHKSARLVAHYTHLQDGDLQGATEALCSPVSARTGNQLVTTGPRLQAAGK